jgi:hypothetical protein
MGRFSWRGIRTPLLAAVTSMLVLVACSEPGGNGAADRTAGDAVQPSEGPATIAPGLVGTWERETRCQELVAALTEAGLEAWVLEGVAGNGFVPGVRSPDEIADPAKPCKGSVPRTHSHFFTEDGRFGSLDWNGEQVDDGTFELVGDDTFVVSKEFPDVTFHYAIDGDSIRFEPVIPDCSPHCFEAAWSVSVAYPGETWVRVDGP